MENVTLVPNQGNYTNQSCDGYENATGCYRNLTGVAGLSAPGSSWDDATWILTSAFVIFTMQSGFGLLESGMVSRKNEVNIMVKNAVDVIFGGLTYWMFGYGLSFGDDEGTNAFCGVGHFFTDSGDADELGWIFAQFVFQASFATTATTIVSGAMAERTKLEAYCLFSLVNTLIYCFPAHWIWAETGIFNKMGAVDIAGAGAVHLVGGITGLTATLMLKPRRGRFSTPPVKMEMSNPTNALLGMFMLWWGWLGFNCGSTFGISGGKWKLATRSAGNTIMSSVGGGVIGLAGSWLTKKRQFDISYLINGVLGGLVACTALCALARPWEGLLIGAIGGTIAVFTPSLLEKIKIDDPVGVIGVHAVAASWGILSVGIFAQPDDIENLNVRSGLLYGGGWELLGIQALMVVTLVAWTGLTSFILLYAIQSTIGLRCSVVEEILGADIIEHGIDQTSPEDRVNVLRELRSLGKEIPEFLFRESSGHWRRSVRTLHASSTTVSKELCDIEQRSSIYSLSSSAILRRRENEDVTFPRCGVHDSYHRRNDLECLKNNGVRPTINGGLTRSSTKKYRGKKTLVPSFTKRKTRLRTNGARQKPMELDVSRLEIRDRQKMDVMETVVIETANNPSS